MTYEELLQFIEEFHKEKEAFLNGEIKDDMPPECRKDWIEKCNA